MLRYLSNPPNPWHGTHTEWLGEPPLAKLEVYEERAKSLVTGNDSPDVGFRWSVNPYRGCQHACAYCYARPSHQYLDFGAGTDFERKIVVKVNAPELLARELSRKSWKGEPICFSGNTDCYQPLEASYRLTGRCLEICAAARNLIVLITKSALVRRDAELLARLSRETGSVVFVSIPFADPDIARALEPGAPPIERRFETLEILSAAGVTTGIAVAPVIPGLSESGIAAQLERGRAAGARLAFMTLIRLPAELFPVFLERARAALPEPRVKRVVSAIGDVRGGTLNESRFHHRMEGHGPRWELIRDLFDSTCRRLGLNAGEVEVATRIEASPAQGSLF